MSDTEGNERLRPTGRKVAHPPTCGYCHGAGCPEFYAPPAESDDK